MILAEALVQLRAGHPMYRKSWDVLDGYVVLMPGMKHVWKIVLTPAPNAGNYMFSMEDLEADDWEIHGEEASVIALEIVEAA